MKNLTDFNSKIEFLLTDIDDTITTEGQLRADAYDALWKLSDAGLKVVPITGRPAGWCEMIARFWPVVGVVGENGGFYFTHKHSSEPSTTSSTKKMSRWFFTDPETIQKNKKRLELIENEVLKTVKGSAISSDQFCRLMDLAVDFCEDVPALGEESIQKIVQIFEKHGAHAKVSSIHVNGWFGDYNKLTTTFQFLKNEFNLTEQEALAKCAFVGDSPNDEPMFERFPHSFGVANILHFQDKMNTHPQYVSPSKGGRGFAEIAQRLIELRK